MERYSLLVIIMAFCAFAMPTKAQDTVYEHISVKYDRTNNVIIYGDTQFVPIEPLTNFADQVPETQVEVDSIFTEDGRYKPGSYEFWLSLTIAIFLTLGAGVMSGLTVGYLSIDRLELELKLENGTDKQKSQALAVLPVLEDHHYLLVTLLLANALCMEALPIYLDSIVPSAYAILLSVIAVLFFGEVIPQAICTGPNQIAIGAFLAPFIQLLKIALGIVAYPIAKVLDCILGEHMATRYTNQDLKALIELHSLHAIEALDDLHVQNKGGLGLKQYQTKIIQSVIDLEFSLNKIMIDASQIFTLNVDTKIDNKIAKKITKKGFSRIPVYEKSDKNRIIGVMLIKTLIGLDLTIPKTIAELVNDGDVTLRKPIFIDNKQKIEPLLTMFLQGKSHMAIVSDNPKKMEEYIKGLEDNGGEMSLILDEEDPTHDRHKKEYQPAKVLGLLTLEDLIEYIIKEDILDEADYDKDLAMNKNPNLRVELHNKSNISTFIAENRDKLKDIVDKGVDETLRNRKKYKFRPEYAKSINLSFRDLSTPLLDKDSRKPRINLEKISDENQEHKA